MVKQRQVVEAGGHIWVLRAKGLLEDFQGAFVERLGVGVLALGHIEIRQVVEADGHLGVLRA